jgi:hypothetical protein
MPIFNQTINNACTKLNSPKTPKLSPITIAVQPPHVVSGNTNIYLKYTALQCTTNGSGMKKCKMAHPIHLVERNAYGEQTVM